MNLFEIEDRARNEWRNCANSPASMTLYLLFSAFKLFLTNKRLKAGFLLFLEFRVLQLHVT